MAGDPPIVELKGVSKSFLGRNGKPVEVLRNLNLEIRSSPISTPGASKAGQFVVLLGPSGCGKSTILNLISGWQLPDEGEVRLKGDLIKGPNLWAATVPQSYTCFPWLTAIGNVEFGLALQHNNGTIQSTQSKAKSKFLEKIGLIKEPEDRDGRRKIAKEYLERVGLANRLDARPDELSGGMQQRVAIARTLAIKRPVILMDEPFGALDAQTREEMQQMLVQLWEEEKNTIIFVTHDITEALLLADRIIIVSSEKKNIELDTPWPRKGPRTFSEFSKTADFLAKAAQLRELLKQMPVGEQPPPEHHSRTIPLSEATQTART